MNLLLKDRTQVVVLAAMVAGGLVIVLGRTVGWPAPLRVVVAVPVMAAVVLSLIRWARAAPDAKDHIR
jgi:hypothetical protein